MIEVLRFFPVYQEVVRRYEGSKKSILSRILAEGKDDDVEYSTTSFEEVIKELREHIDKFETISDITIKGDRTRLGHPRTDKNQLRKLEAKHFKYNHLSGFYAIEARRILEMTDNVDRLVESVDREVKNAILRKYGLIRRK